MEISQTEKRVGLNLTEGSILRTLILFSVPLVLTELVQQLYSVVDLMVIGKFAGSSGTVGVSIGGEVADLLTPVAMALSGAGQVYIAQLAGAREERRMRETIGTLLTIMLAASLFFSGAAWLFCDPILRILNCPEEAFAQAKVYLLTTTVGFPFIFGYNAVCAVLRGMGESRRPLIFISIAASVNIVMDILLVAVIPLGAMGTAIATVLAQAGSCSAALFFLYKRREQFGFALKRSYFRIHREPLRILLTLGIPKLIQSVCIRFSLLWCSSHINSYGITASAANSIGNKLQKMITVFSNAVTTASGAMIGQNAGARRPDRVKKIVWTTFAWSCAVATAGSLLGLTMPKALYGLFTDEAAVMELGVVYLRITVITFYLAACLGTFQSLINGIGFAAFNFLIGILDGVVCRIGFSVLFVYGLGMEVTGFFLGNAMARSIPVVICFAYFISGKWINRKLLVD